MDLASPPARRPSTLKRTASTASLLTPPRTYRRRARGRSRGSCDSDSDSDAAGGEYNNSSDEEGAGDDELPTVNTRGRAHQSKKRRLEKSKGVEDDEEARFWGGADKDATGEAQTQPKASGSRTKGPLVYQRFKNQQQTGLSSVHSSAKSALVSPPPSHRKTATAVVLPPGTPSPIATASLPVTPQPKTPTRREKEKKQPAAPGGFVDSPTNPFAPGVESDGEAEVESPSDLVGADSSPTPAYDKPTVTYVL